MDTPGHAVQVIPAWRVRAAFTALVILVQACMSPDSRSAMAAPFPLNAKVVWAGQRQALIVSDSALTLKYGDVIRFLSRDKVVAEGEIQSVPSWGIGVVLFRSIDPLKGIKKLDRLRLAADPRAEQMPSLLRLGYPADARLNLLFACTGVRPSGLDSLYRVEKMTDHRFLLVRNPDRPTDHPWADTLQVRLFDDSGDEEIAFERGELDAAMFWPGELSAHAREHWNNSALHAPRARGIIAAMWLRADGRPDSVTVTTADRLALMRFHRELFDTDMASADDGRVHPDSTRRYLFYPDSQWHAAARFEVDHQLPGWRIIERMLNTRPGSNRVMPDSVRIWLLLVDAPLDDGPAIARAVAERLRTVPVPPELRARADSLVAETEAMHQLDPRRLLWERLNLKLQFVPWCPMLYRGSLEPVLMRLSDELVNLLECAPSAPR